jgi:hypothetical protein
MKMTYRTVCKDIKRLRSMTGFDRRGFEVLHGVFAEVALEYLRHFTWEGKERQRGYSVKRDSVFKSTEDMLLFLLSYLKNNPLQEYHAALFGMTQPQANVRIGLLTGWLHTSLERLGELPPANQQQFDRAVSEATELLLDGTERPIPRSVDYQTQEEHFNGKKSGTR